MQASNERNVLLERRRHTETQNLWDKLSLAQQFAYESLTEAGYDLAFIRYSRIGNLAVLLKNNNAATITSDGEINTSPSITCR